MEKEKMGVWHVGCEAGGTEGKKGQASASTGGEKGSSEPCAPDCTPCKDWLLYHK